MESSYIERITVALESIAKSLKGIEESMYLDTTGSGDFDSLSGILYDLKEVVDTGVNK